MHVSQNFGEIIFKWKIEGKNFDRYRFMQISHSYSYSVSFWELIALVFSEIGRTSRKRTPRILTSIEKLHSYLSNSTFPRNIYTWRSLLISHNCFFMYMVIVLKVRTPIVLALSSMLLENVHKLSKLSYKNFNIVHCSHH